MKVFIIIAAVLVISCSALPVAEEYFIENEDGEVFYLVPVEESSHSINKRQIQTKGNLDKDGTLSLSHSQSFIKNDRHTLDANAFGSKNIKQNGPLTLGGGVDFSHNPSATGVGVSASNTRGFGTDVSATGRTRIYQSPNGRTSLHGNAGVSQHYGGPQGNGKPNVNAGLILNW